MPVNRASRPEEHRITTRLSALVLASSVVASVGLVGAAFVTVDHAGCDAPGHFTTGADGTAQLVGGCLTAGALVVPGRPIAPAAVPHAPPGLRP